MCVTACMACRNTIADLGTSAMPPPVATTCSASGVRVAVCSQKSNEYAIFYKPKGRPWRNSSTKERSDHLWPRIDAGTASQARPSVLEPFPSPSTCIKRLLVVRVC